MVYRCSATERQGVMTKITDSEWKIMRVLWDKSPQTLMEITRALSDDNGWSKNTVLTFLKRMESNGVISYQEGKNAKHFYPLIEESDAMAEKTEQFLDNIFDGKMGLMLNTMIRKNSLSDTDIEELYKILDDAGRNDK